MEQCFKWLSQPSNDGKPIDQEILAQLISASRQKVTDLPHVLDICRLLVNRLLKEVVTENALSTGLALCSALMSSGLTHVSDIVSRWLSEEVINKHPERWFLVYDPTEDGRTDGSVNWVPLSEVFIIGICHGTVNTALYKSFNQNELSRFIFMLLLLCKKPSRLTTTAIRVLTSAVTRFRELPPERLECLKYDFVPIVRYGWNGPANSPKEIRRLTEAILESEYNNGRMQRKIVALPWGSRTKLLACSAMWSTCSRENVLQYHTNLTEKLAASLSEPRLVAAGTDAYLAFLGHVQDADVWWAFFSGPLLPLLLHNGDWGATKAIFTHWLPPALKKFPSLYQKLLDAIPGDDDAQLCTLVLLHNEANKIISMPVQLSPDNTDAVSCGLCHKNDTVRLAAFSVVCRGFTPRHQEAVTAFLSENVTCDSAPMRQGIVGCIRTLLSRLIKITHSSVSDGGLTSFLQWLHAFLTQNLAVGVGNYQRRLLSLLLFGCVLGVAEKSVVFHKLVPEEKWSTKSEENLNLLLCVLVSDPAKNIRQEARNILTHHFSPNDPHLKCRLAVRGIDTCRSGWFFRAEIALEIFGLVSAWLGDDGICCGCLQEGGVFRSEFASSSQSEVQVANRNCVELCPAMVNLRCSEALDAGEKAEEMFEGGANNRETAERRHVLGCPAKMLESNASQIEALFSSLFYGSDQILVGEIGESTLSVCKCPEICLRADEPKFDQTRGHVSLVTLLLWEAQKQWLNLQEDPVAAAVQGNAVHGVLSALTSVAVDRFSSSQIQTALLFVEEVVDWVLGVLASQSSGLSPSFADMGIALSSLADKVESDEQLLHLSPAFQTALNCLWLNLKACCDVAAHLVSSPEADGDAAVRFLRVITSVLTQCRHKGAIEAAGRALSSAVKIATSEKCDRVTRTGILLREVPGNLLAAVLDQLIPAETTVSLTRRSAGVAILVHRIVIGDSAYGHPLLGMAVRRLLTLAVEPVDPKQPANVDWVQTQAIHCLTAIVKEASLRAQVSTYTGDVAIICLCSLVKANNWNVRNAGLQLYAAVVPRLTGSDQNGGAPLNSFDALRWRYSGLGNCVVHHVTRGPAEDAMDDTSVVPALTLLAALCCDADTAPSRSVPVLLLRRLKALYSGSRCRQVRVLAAEAFANGSGLRSLPTLVAECGAGGHWNGLHGRLLCLEFLLRWAASKAVDVPECVHALRIPLRSPWPCREVYDRVRRFLRESVTAEEEISGNLQELLDALSQGRDFDAPGFFPWADARARDVINSCEDAALLEPDLRPLLTGEGLEARCLDVCASALLELRSRVRRRPPSPADAAALLEILLEALSAGPRSADVELHLLEAAQTLTDAVATPGVVVGRRHEALLEELGGRHAAALPLLALVSLASRRRPELLRLCAASVASHGLRRDSDDVRRVYAGVALATLLPSLVPEDGDAAEELLDAAATLQEDDVAEVRDAVGSPLTARALTDALGPRRAVDFLWRRLVDVTGVLEACDGRLSPFGQESDALREEPCRTASLTRDTLAAILAGHPGASTLALDVGKLADAVARVVKAYSDKGTYLTMTAARLVSVKLGLLCDTLSSTEGDQDVCDALRGLREEVEGCLSRLAP